MFGIGNNSVQNIKPTITYQSPFCSLVASLKSTNITNGISGGTIILLADKVSVLVKGSANTTGDTAVVIDYVQP